MDEHKVLKVDPTDSLYGDWEYIIVATDMIHIGETLYGNAYWNHTTCGDYSWGNKDFDARLKADLIAKFGENAKQVVLAEHDRPSILSQSSFEEGIKMSKWLDYQYGNILDFVKKWVKEHEVLTKGDFIIYTENGYTQLVEELRRYNEFGKRRSKYMLLDDDNEIAIKIIEEYEKTKDEYEFWGEDIYYEPHNDYFLLKTKFLTIKVPLTLGLASALIDVNK